MDTLRGNGLDIGLYSRTTYRVMAGKTQDDGAGLLL
jgi:hypothetical protein